MAGLWFRMFRVDRTEVRGTMHGVQVKLDMGELRTEFGMQIQVKQDRLSATTTTVHVHALLSDTNGVEALSVSALSRGLICTLRIALLIANNEVFPNFAYVNGLQEQNHGCGIVFLRSKKDETPEVVIKFLKQIQVGLNKIVRYIRTNNGTEFVNKDLTEYYERVSIFHQKTVSRTPQQNGVVERRNHTLVEAARTMLIFSKASMFLWVEAVATACYSQNRSLIHTRHIKTPYELVHDKKPDLTFLRVFGALCYPINDSKDLGKLQTNS
ncbi:putative ribonuclease H-like domain-containing protein [Tanacetum coccineum]|uniref:Ribonuclease H-like domain-containing protein n=1 Tax=Tanacetum coccineum TaxID=301880 RepID=A0ABQ5E4P9_9ASTR